MQADQAQDRSAGIRRLLVRFRELPPSFSTVSVVPGKHKVFKWFLTTCVIIAIASTCIENGLHPLLLLLLPVIAAGLLRDDYGREFFLSQKTSFIFFFIYVVLLAIAALSFRSSFTLPISMVYFTFGVLIVRVLTPLTDRNVEQLILLSLGLILVNCIITNHLVFGIMLPVYLFSLMGTLMLFHLARTPARAQESFDPASVRSVREAITRKLALSAFFILVFSVLFFVLIPRPFISMPGLRFGAPASGLGTMTQRISYRQMIGMADMQRIAFMVRLEAGSLPRFPYWRGRVLEKNDGRGWVYAAENKNVTKPVRIDYSQAIAYDFIPYKLQTNTIYAYGFPVGALGKMDRPLYIDPGGEIIVDSPFLYSDSYKITVLNRPFPLGRLSVRFNLDKTGITPRIEALAREWTEGLTSPEAKSSRIVSRLTDRCKYVLQPAPPPEQGNPTEYFLFDSREGNCEYFAGALCLMLRSEGIPARVVEGFAGMDRSSVENEYIVRFGHAHAWVEAALDDNNWTTLDATPPSRLDLTGSLLFGFITDMYDTIEKKWTKYVVYFDRSDQAKLFELLRELQNMDVELPTLGAVDRVSLMTLFFAGAAVLAIFIVAYAMRKKRRSAESIYMSAMRDMAHAGVLESVHPWHEQNTEKILSRAPQAADLARQFMKLYFDSRFGTNGVSIKKLEEAKKELVRAAKGAA
ncbi:MAG: DUF3488 domain-containing protein [Desulfomonile tiedjei]|uniref:DUF3488 domain-containing protein n=1 Tax=Desulfomonile tiedjei TaxID=2358 RepID=A0A9D6UZL7_9BACT|nr:DUF3488 domain-containing protein [Desulfomonile tiedjei]